MKEENYKYETSRLTIQARVLKEMLAQDKALYEIIQSASALNIPNLYVGGGCITQTVWNQIYNQPLGYGISDVDIVYFDGNLGEEQEAQTIAQIKAAIKPTRYAIDVKNESRVHLWYQEKFGFAIPPYTPTEEAISTWPSTATALGVYLDKEQELQIFAPFGLYDLFKGILRPNKTLVSQGIYDEKVKKWSTKWPELQVVEW